MHDRAERLHGVVVNAREEEDADFEARLADSSALAIRVAFSVLRNQHDAEDVAQEAFAKAYRSFGQLRDRDRFRAWLVRMTWRMALDFAKGRRRRMVRECAAVNRSSEPTVEDQAIEDERTAAVWNAVDALPERLRMVIVLSAMEGQSVKDVAALLGVPEGTVKSRLFVARRALQEKLR